MSRFSGWQSCELVGFMVTDMAFTSLTLKLLPLRCVEVDAMARPLWSCYLSYHWHGRPCKFSLLRY